MGLFDFLAGKNVEDNYAIALDIGTEYAKSLIFRVEDGKVWWSEPAVSVRGYQTCKEARSRIFMV